MVVFLSAISVLGSCVACVISEGESDVILVFVPLHIKCFFPLAYFSNFFHFLLFSPIWL